MPRRSGQRHSRTPPDAAALLHASDPMDLGAHANARSDDAHEHIANRPVALGRDQCVTELAALFRTARHWGQFREVQSGPDGETVLMEPDMVPIDALAEITRGADVGLAPMLCASSARCPGLALVTADKRLIAGGQRFRWDPGLRGSIGA